MPFANLQDYVDRAIFAAQSATKLGENPVISADMEAETLVPNALHQLATMVAEDVERRHLLQKTTSVALDANGRGTLDPSLLSQFLDDGSVRDADTSVNLQQGNLLVRVHQFNDFLGYLPTMLGYYALHNNQIHTRAKNSGGLADTQGPLTVDCAYVPIATEVPEELVDDAVEILARLLLKAME